MRKLRCAASIATLSVQRAEENRGETLRSAGHSQISTLCEISSWPLPLLGSSRRVQQAKLTGLSLFVGREVTDVVDHASPVSFFRPASIGTVREIMLPDRLGEELSRYCSSASSVLTSRLLGSPQSPSIACSATASRCGFSIRPCSFRLGSAAIMCSFQRGMHLELHRTRIVAVEHGEIAHRRQRSAPAGSAGDRQSGNPPASAGCRGPRRRLRLPGELAH